MMMPLGWYIAVALQVRPDFKNPKSDEASAWFYTSVDEVSKAAGWCARQAEGCRCVGDKLRCTHIVCYICIELRLHVACLRCERTASMSSALLQVVDRMRSVLKHYQEQPLSRASTRFIPGSHELVLQPGSGSEGGTTHYRADLQADMPS